MRMALTPRLCLVDRFLPAGGSGRHLFHTGHQSHRANFQGAEATDQGHGQRHAQRRLDQPHLPRDRRGDEPIVVGNYASGNFQQQMKLDRPADLQ